MVAAVSALAGLVVGPLLRTLPEYRNVGALIALGGLCLVPLAGGSALYAVAKTPAGTRALPFGALCIVAFILCVSGVTAMNAVPESRGVWFFGTGVAAASLAAGAIVVWRGPRDARYLGHFLMVQGLWVLLTGLFRAA